MEGAILFWVVLIYGNVVKVKNPVLLAFVVFALTVIVDSISITLWS